jgi:hypothetical protein
MRTSRLTTLGVAGILNGLTSCERSQPVQNVASSTTAADRVQPSNQPVGKKMKVTIGSKTFAATLEDNPAAAKLNAMLPITLAMSELNGNEKFFRLPAPLPTDDANPGTIRAGDLMLWQADTVALFYKAFRTSYSYTRLGRIDDPAGLAAAVGSGGVTVRIESE